MRIHWRMMRTWSPRLARICAVSYTHLFEADGRQEDGWLEDGYRPKGWKKAQVMKGELYLSLIHN